MTLTEPPLGFWAVADADPDRLAVIDATGTKVTFGELHAASNRLARALLGLGLERGDDLAVVLPNGIPFAQAYLAAMQTGLYFTCVNWHLTAGEMAHILADAEAAAVLADGRFAGEVAPATAEAGIDARARIAVGDIRRSPKSRSSASLTANGEKWSRPSSNRRPMPSRVPTWK